MKNSKPKLTRNERMRRRMTEGSLPLSMAKFGLPLVIGMALHTTFNLVDMFMISRLENATANLAALGLCDMIAAIATILSNGISTAAVALIARRMGAHDLRGVRWASWQSLWLVGALSIGFGMVGLFGSDWIIHSVMQAKGEVAVVAVPYLRIMLGGCFSIFFLLQITAILRALGHSKSAGLLLIGGNALNLLLNLVLVYGTGPRPEVFAWSLPLAQLFDVPRMGVVGAAWSTLIGRTVPVILGMALLLRRKGGPRFRWFYLRPHAQELRTILRIGWPTSAQLVVRIAAILVFLSLVSAHFTTIADPSSLTAYSICLRLETMALFVGMGWGAAASSFVGVNLGASQLERARNSGWIAAGYNVLLMLFLVWGYQTFAEPIVSFFDTDPQVIRIGKEYLNTVGWSYAFVGLAVVLSQAMTGAGATLSSLIIDSIILVVFVIPTAFLVTQGEGSRLALWQTIFAGNFMAALAYAVWYMRGRFLKTSASSVRSLQRAEITESC